MLLFLLACDSTPPPAPTPPAWVVPLDVASDGPPTEADWTSLAWGSLVALAWPAVPPDATQAGQPDPVRPLGATAGGMIPSVWMTWRDLDSVLLPDASDPGPWAPTAEAVPEGCKAAAVAPLTTVPAGYTPMILDDLSKKPSNAPFPLDDVHEATGQPLFDQHGWPVLYDIRLSESEYTFLRERRYYDAAAQQADVEKQQFGDFPDGVGILPKGLPPWAAFGTTEVKAAWRVLLPGQDDPGRYVTQVGYFAGAGGDCVGPVTFGLVGLHILRLTPQSDASWFWASFEHVDNTSVPSPAPLRPDGTPLTPSFAPAAGWADGACPPTPAGACSASDANCPPDASIPVVFAGTNPPTSVCRVTAIPPEITTASAAWQRRAPIAGTPWQYYQLVGTVHPTPTGTGVPMTSYQDDRVNTATMANSTLETYQQESNCVSCHATAAPQGFPEGQDVPHELQNFTFILGNAASSSPSPANPGSR